jgi:hypothetical protein
MRFTTSSFWPKSWRNHAHKSWNMCKPLAKRTHEMKTVHLVCKVIGIFL